MLDFQKKVEELRRFESLCFTICMTLLAEEQAACKAAEQVLCQLFGDIGFWKLNEKEKSPYILRICTRECFQWKQQNLLQTS
ncbi:hypothetical protein [Paenibacillus luteus]|uniref:hypothetical protein n=1 Tax=Paenibacillus luteus TaxID=2545753 RepID=UPI0011421093|nr:hypothetical protein [Paenibacillus luteus]